MTQLKMKIKTQCKKYCFIIFSMIAIFLLYRMATFNQFVYADNKPAPVRKFAVKEIPAPPSVPTEEQLKKLQTVSIIGWNVENLFEAEVKKNTLPKYSGADRNIKHVKQKLYNITDVLRRVNNGYGADIVGLCEVENKNILNELANHPNLQPLQYKYQYLIPGQDFRNINVALLSRYPAIATEAKLMYPGGRNILMGKFNIHNHMLYVLVNHWRSQIGGESKTEHYREQAAKVCYKMVKNILQEDPNADIVLLGDFNEVSTGKAVSQSLGATLYKGNVTNAKLYNLTHSIKWAPWVKTKDSFDQIILSRGLFDKKGFSYKKNSFKIISFKFQCNAQGYPLVFSHKDGHGYSDHFPVYCELTW